MSGFFRRLPPAPKVGDPHFWAKNTARMEEGQRRSKIAVVVCAVAFVASVINTIVVLVVIR